MRGRQGVLASVLVVVLGVAGELAAQTATGQITGTVKDTSGAVIPDVKVTATNQGTSIARSTTTTASGDYSFPLLPVSTYTVSAEKQGFQLVKRSDIQLNVAAVVRVDLELALG